ncbi:MAG: BREX-1 system adenine-specific DNA-methyltransferase PglX [Cetobacterium sp.]
MNKSSIRKFAVESRRWLIEKMIIRLEQLGITAKGFSEPFAVTETEIKITETAEPIERVKYEELKNYVNKLKSSYEKEWYNELLEEAAYTWFNRFVAIKFMEVNGYLPDRINVLTSSTGKVEPDIMQEYEYLSFVEKLDVQYIKFGLLDHKTEEIFRYLFLEQCSELGKIMDFMFEKEHDYSELLFPEGVLGINGIVKSINNDISEEDWQETEIIGWLYQYYNSESRAEVYDGSMKKSKIKKEYIASATQLFTPEWIVKYITQNTLGKMIEENLDLNLKSEWEYYLEPKDDNYVKNKIDNFRLEDLKVLDPAMGSGHILIYAFDILFEAYLHSDYSKKEAVKAILKNNLYGLEIDDRAGQLAQFALLMKARKEVPGILREKIELNLTSFGESNGVNEELVTTCKEKGLDKLVLLLETFKDAKEIGSIIKFSMTNDELIETEEQLKKLSENNLFIAKDEIELFKRLIKQTKILSDKYDILIENPPYMGSGRMEGKLKNYIEKNYKEVKSDLFAVFFIKSCELGKKHAYLGFMSPFVWMFIKSYEDLRNYFIEDKTITSLIQLEYSGFEDATVPICAFTLKNSHSENKGEYIRLSDFKGPKNQPIKTKEAVKNLNVDYRYTTNQKDFKKIPGSPIAYWVSKKFRKIFNLKKMSDICDVKKGLSTGENDIYLKKWTEVCIKKVGLNISCSEKAKESLKKWFPYNKGGEFRKWYGNREYLINWEDDGFELKNSSRAVLRNQSYYFKDSITWSAVSSSKFGVRSCEEGFLFDGGGSCAFVESKYKNYILSFLASKLNFYILNTLIPTLNFEIGVIASLPILFPKTTEEQKIKNLTQKNIVLSKQEWDSRETSWDFEKSPLLMESSITEAYKSYCEFWTKEFFQMHSNEEELNRLFIEIYDLQDEMDEKVELKDITLLKNEIMRVKSKGKKKKSEDDEEEDSSIVMEDGKPVFNRNEIAKQFLSYIIGCALGRYSIDKPGLIMANSDDKLDLSNGFKVLGLDGEIRHNIQNPRIAPSIDGIIPLTDKNYFGNTDIIETVESFLKAVWGEAVLEENLDWIAKSLKDSEESSRDIIRSYFINDFMEDHIKRYNKRPIYWLITSNGKGKDAGFNALIYLHRYNQNTMPLLRNRYVNELQAKVSSKLEIDRKRELETNLTTIEKRKIKKDIELAQKQLNELIDLDKKLNNLINQNISLDLDDGVKVNYFKIQNEEDILYKIKL